MTNTETSPQSGGPSTQQTVDDAVLKAASVVRIVDDDVAMRRSYEFMLTMAKWRTKLYDSAEAFLDGDDPEIPGAIILDVRMPGISGLALQDRLSADGNDLPVIFVTGHGDVDMAVRAVKHGAFLVLRCGLGRGSGMKMGWKRVGRGLVLEVGSGPRGVGVPAFAVLPSDRRLVGRRRRVNRLTISSTVR